MSIVTREREKESLKKNKQKGKIVSQNIQLDLHCISYFKYCMTNQKIFLLLFLILKSKGKNGCINPQQNEGEGEGEIEKKRRQRGEGE